MSSTEHFSRVASKLAFYRKSESDSIYLCCFQPVVANRYIYLEQAEEISRYVPDGEAWARASERAVLEVRIHDAHCKAAALQVRSKQSGPGVTQSECQLRP
jgi:hypothetical protein